jgi:esterase/lipase superfamily enzyme
MATPSRMKGILSIAAMLVLMGCATSRPLMPTPAIYVDEKEGLLEDVSPALRTAEADILYVTDRQPEQDESGNLRYGYGRSKSLAFGSVVVNLGDGLTWDELVASTQSSSFSGRVELSVRSIEEIGRFPRTPAPYTVVDNAFIEDRDYQARQEQAAERFRQEVLHRLELTPRKEVFIYVHGYNNTFEDAAYVSAEYWHFLGREAVPIVYTWPAGYPGLFGYTYDRESSEFTVFHLKQMLSILSAMPEVKGIHLTAHSRGTDTVTAAVRELFILARGAGLHPRQRYKIQNLVLAAPDLDVEVLQQRLTAERVDHGFGNFTIYFSPSDEAIGIAESLFSSPRGRIGTLDLAKVTAEDMEVVEQRHERFAVIRFDPVGSDGEEAQDRYGHSYYRLDPRVSSDIVLMLRYGLPPGSPGRPLEKIRPGFYRIPPGYPFVGERVE